MTVYLLTFASSYLCCLKGEEQFASERKRQGCIWFLLAVLAVSILAGVRDVGVGTDTMTYQCWAFWGARESEGLLSYIHDYSDLDLLYVVLNYILSRIFYDEHWLYFFSGLIIYGCILCGLLKYRGHIRVSMAWISFLLLFYASTYNATRQWLAIAVAFYAFSFVMEKRYLQFAAGMVVAYFFHDTALFFLAIFFVYCVFQKLKRQRTILALGIAMTSVFTVVIANYQLILQFLMDIGILNEKYVRYLTTASSGVSLNPMLVRLPFLLLVFLFYREFRDGENRYYTPFPQKATAPFLVCMMMLEIVSSLTRSILVTLYRISYYFGIFRCVALGRLDAALPEERGGKILYPLILTMLVVIWLYQNVLQGNDGVFPYTSSILGIL